MTAGCAIAPPLATSLCYAKSPSTSSPLIAAVKPAFAVGVKRPPGTTTTCSGSFPASLMREPCSTPQVLDGLSEECWQGAPLLPGHAAPLNATDPLFPLTA